MLKRLFVLSVALLSISNLAVALPADFQPGTLSGWQAQGNVWGVVESKRGNSPGKFHAESLAGGEQATGSIKSDPFTITGSVLTFYANGWDGRYGGKGVNGYYLKSAQDGKILRSAAPPCNDSFTRIAWLTSDLKGQRVYFEAVDGDTEDAFAWLGFARIREQSLALTPYRPMKLPAKGVWAVIERNGAGARVAPYLSSLAQGEQATGMVVSHDFVVTTDVIRFSMCGHDGQHGGKKANFACLRDIETKKAIRTTYAPGSDMMVPIEWDVKEFKGRKVRFEVVDSNADYTFAWLGINDVDAGDALKLEIKSAVNPAGWRDPNGDARSYVTACGVPFSALPSGMSVIRDSEKGSISCGFMAKRIFLLGMINSPDRGNPCWAWMNHADRYFIGDSAGDLFIRYTDGSSDRVPLVFGRTMWWHNNYTGMGATEPYSTDPGAKAVLDDVLAVRPTGLSGGHAYVCALQPGNKLIKAIEIIDNPKKNGAPVITAITVDVEGDANGESLLPEAAAPAPSADEKKWLEKHTIKTDSSSYQYQAGLDDLRRTIYTSDEDFKGSFKVDVPKGFRGPSVTLKGTPYAEALTNIYYHSTQDMDDKVDPDGVFHTSTKGAPSWGSYEGFGTWLKNYSSYYAHAWSRDLGRVLQELTELGYDTDSIACAKWCNEQLMWFPKQFPRVNVEGKPTPGHWVRIINLPEATQTPGMPELFGNLENDGHGLIMIFQYKAWQSSGKSPDYVKANWEAVREAAEYICWLFDNPKVSKAHKNALASESEGGGMHGSIYCDFPCWLGLQAYAEMAQAAGKADDAKRWLTYADRLKDGFNNFYPSKHEKYGDIWDPGKCGGWPFGHSVLAPVMNWPDYFGYDLSTMPADWLERSRNTLAYQLSRCEPAHASGIAMGYGQCFLTESALLLDEMDHAAECLNWLAKFTYCKGHKPYIVPEGCEIDQSYKWWHRTGDLGNAVQEGEGVKCIRMVLGIDDTNPAKTLFIPRMPGSWSEISTARYPVMTIENGKLVKRNVNVSLKKKGEKYIFNMKSDAPLAEADVRIGPFTLKTSAVRLEVNGAERIVRTHRSGDSTWAWVKGLEGVREILVKFSETE